MEWSYADREDSIADHVRAAVPHTTARGCSRAIVPNTFLTKTCRKEHLWTQAEYVGPAGNVSAEVIRRSIEECQGKEACETTRSALSFP
jgi:REP element-mobilizing transposase RayT